MAHHGGHKRRFNFPERIKARQAAALERNTAWRLLSYEQQLASLDERGYAATAQRARIQLAIERRDAQEATPTIIAGRGANLERHAKANRNDKKARRKASQA